MTDPTPRYRQPVERVSCARCGSTYTRPLGVARPHKKCPAVALDEARERLAERRGLLEALAAINEWRAKYAQNVRP